MLEGVIWGGVFPVEGFERLDFGPSPEAANGSFFCFCGLGLPRGP